MVGKVLILACVLFLVQDSLGSLIKPLRFPHAKRNATKVGATTYGYILSSETANWYKAYVSCLESDMELAAVTTEEQEQKLDFALRTSNEGDSYWLSANNLVDSETAQYYWFTGGKRAVYTNWLPDEPNNDGGVENCLGWEKREGAGVGWNDFECTIEKNYVCQYEA